MQPQKLLGRGGAEKISSATIVRQQEMRQKQLESQAVDGASTDQQDSNRGLELQVSKDKLAVKPSMMSVAESAVQEEMEDQDEETKSCTPASSFKATQKGISIPSLYPGKTVHSLDFKNIHRSTINTLNGHIDTMPMPKKVAIAKKKAAAEEKK